MSVLERRRRRRRPKRRPRRAVPPAVIPPPTATTPSPPPAAPPTVQQPVAPVGYPLDVPDAQARLFLNRLGTGYTPAALAAMRARGGPMQWLEWQLTPDQVPENPKVAEIDIWFPYLRNSPAQIGADNASRVRQFWKHVDGFNCWTLMRRVYSARMVQEQMVSFLNNVLHCSTNNDQTAPYRFDYDATVRRHAFGRFEDLLIETSLHPAMRVYLDNRTSTKTRLNENQGREILELHTVSRAANYTETDVLNSARILSGYTVDWYGTWDAFYDPKRHWTGPVTVMGFSDANAAADGQAVTLRYLKYLAKHPATARTLARRMAVHFVSDNPSTGLVDRLAQAYTDNDTSLKAMLMTLAKSPEFLGSEGAKVRTPTADYVATARVLGVTATTPTTGDAYAYSAQWTHGDLAVYQWPRPDGPPLTNGAWSSAGRILKSVDMHLCQTAGYWPTDNVTYQKARSWLPLESCTFAQLTDHLCRAWLGRPADARLQTIANQVTGWSPSRVVTAATFPEWVLALLGQALLSTPEHMTT